MQVSKDIQSDLLGQLNKPAGEKFEFRGVEIIDVPGVFSPVIFPSSLFFAGRVLDLLQRECSLLEVGAGQGILSICAAKEKNCTVYSTDISKKAIHAIKVNAKRNEANIKIIESDLFDGLEQGFKFDVVVWNSNFLTTSDSLKDESLKTFIDFEYRAHNRFLKSLHSVLAVDGCCYLGLGYKSLSDVHVQMLHKSMSEVTLIDSQKIEEESISFSFGIFKLVP